MRFMLLSDIHATSKNPVARKDDILSTTIHKIRYLLRLARKENAVILQAGDFFDKPRDWNLLLIIINLIKAYKVKIFNVYGQHDTYLRTDLSQSATTLGILYKTNYFNLLSKTPTIFENHINVYGVSWRQEIPEPEGTINILVIHSPISMSELYPDHKYIGAKWFAKKYKEYNLILTGDIHQSFLYSIASTTIINTGPVLRLEATEYNMTHRPCGYIYDTQYGTIEKFTIPHEKAERVLSRSHIEKTKFNKSTMQKFIDSIDKEIKTDYKPSQKLKEMLVEWLESNKIGSSIQRIITEAIEDEH